ncbi:MAG: sigma-70 family RNA polymerase sigma factor [Armatimonadota bacterium]|nr:sigma-70 family RNA polymerase sigma factor [Armatimonadota bacterium]
MRTRIASTNAALDLIRRRPASPPIELPVDLSAPGGPEHEAVRREIHRRVHAALGTLPAEFRAAVVLRDLQGLSYDDVARVLQVPVGTVRSRISRGREALRAQLTDLVASQGERE